MGLFGRKTPTPNLEDHLIKQESFVIYFQQQELLKKLLNKKNKLSEEQMAMSQKFKEINAYQLKFSDPRNHFELRTIVNDVLNSEELRHRIQSCKKIIERMISAPSSFLLYLKLKDSSSTPILSQALSVEEAYKKNLKPIELEIEYQEKLQDHYKEIIENYLKHSLLNDKLGPKQIHYLRNLILPILNNYVSNKIDRHSAYYQTQNHKFLDLLTKLDSTDDNNFEIAIKDLQTYLTSLRPGIFSFTPIFKESEVSFLIQLYKQIYQEKKFSALLKNIGEIRLQLHYSFPDLYAVLPDICNPVKSDSNYDIEIQLIASLGDQLLEAKWIKPEDEALAEEIENILDDLFILADDKEKKSQMITKLEALNALLIKCKLEPDDQAQIFNLCSYLYFQQPLSFEFQEEIKELKKILDTDDILYLQSRLEDYAASQKNCNAIAKLLRQRLWHEIKNLPQELDSRLEELVDLQTNLTPEFLSQINKPQIMGEQIQAISEAIEEVDKNIIDHIQHVENEAINLLKAQILHATSLYLSRKKSAFSHHDSAKEDPIIFHLLKRILLTKNIVDTTALLDELLENYKPHGLHTNSLDTFLIQVLNNNPEPQGLFTLFKENKSIAINNYALPPLEQLPLENTSTVWKNFLEKNFKVVAPKLDGDISKMIRGKERQPKEVRESILQLTRDNLQNLGNAFGELRKNFFYLLPSLVSPPNEASLPSLKSDSSSHRPPNQPWAKN